MKNLVMLCGLILLVSCGQESTKIEGAPGADGQSCYTETRGTSNFVVCPDGEFEVVDGKDGEDGKDGVDGEDAYTELVQLCEEVAGSHIETLLYVNGKYMAFLASSNYKKERLVLLSEGVVYSTTDGRNIKFTIVDGSIAYLTNGCETFNPNN